MKEARAHRMASHELTAFEITLALVFHQPNVASEKGSSGFHASNGSTSCALNGNISCVLNGNTSCASNGSISCALNGKGSHGAVGCRGPWSAAGWVESSNSGRGTETSIGDGAAAGNRGVPPLPVSGACVSGMVRLELGGDVIP